MHGPTYVGDCETSLHDLGSAYEERLAGPRGPACTLRCCHTRDPALASVVQGHRELLLLGARRCGHDQGPISGSANWRRWCGPAVATFVPAEIWDAGWCPGCPSCSRRRHCRGSWTSDAGTRWWPCPTSTACWPGIPTRWSSRSPAARGARSRPRAGQGRGRLPGVRHRDQRLAPAPPRLGRRRRARHSRAARLRGGGRPPRHRRRPRRACPSPSSPTAAVEGASTRCGSTSPLSRSRAGTRTAHHSSSPTPGCPSGRRSRVPACSRGRRHRRASSQPSSRTGMSASRRAAVASTAVRTVCATSTSEMFSHGVGIPLETCALVDDGRAWCPGVQRRAGGTTRAAAGRGRRVRPGPSGRLAAVRMYDDTDPALHPQNQ